MTGRGPLVPAAALLALAAAAVVAWSSRLGGFSVAIVPVAALAAPALAGRRPVRRATGALAVWLLAAPALAGVPAEQLDPGAWTALPSRLSGGVLALTGPSVAAGGEDRWPLAAGLLLAGAAWIAAAALARRRTGMAFAAGAAPWLAAVLLHPAGAGVWQGAAVVLAGLLLHAWPRTSARAAVALSVVLAAASAITAQAVVPAHRWFALPGSGDHGPPHFGRLETMPTFERLADRRTGAPMLEITAPEPALWRMQVLDVFDGYGWSTGEWLPRLPEPAARRELVDVRVRGLHNDLVASPGAIAGVTARGDAEAAAGEAWRLVPGPRPGDEYHVDARVVRPGAARLRRATPPRDPAVAAYTRLGRDGPRSPREPAVLHVGPFTIPLTSRDAEPQGLPIDVPLFGAGGAGGARAEPGSPYRGVAELARRLASGARTEWQVVAHVIQYLRDGNRFRYSTDVGGSPGPYPLADFLLRTRAGYCQHFAGAAALLLRLAGVPTRMVAGFATGVRRGTSFEVRDVDAHDWIEVYFAGSGWVPFNPTPEVAPAAIPTKLDLLAPTAGPGRVLDWRAYAIAGVLLAVLAARRRRRARPQPGEVLARLLGTPVLPSTTLGELGDRLARELGPHTSALAAEAEQARFSPRGAASRRWARARIARALVRDVGPRRAALLLAGAAAAGARASQQDSAGEIA